MALRRAFVALLVLVATLGFTAASATATTLPTYTQRNSGTTVKVKQGSTFIIKLRTAADGGYSWVVTHGRNSKDFTILSRRVVSPKGMVGGYAQTIWTIRATRIGTDYFSAIERRSFEKNSTIAHFKLTITVIRGH